MPKKPNPKSLKKAIKQFQINKRKLQKLLDEFEGSIIDNNLTHMLVNTRHKFKSKYLKGCYIGFSKKLCEFSDKEILEYLARELKERSLLGATNYA